MYSTTNQSPPIIKSEKQSPISIQPVFGNPKQYETYSKDNNRLYRIFQKYEKIMAWVVWLKHRVLNAYRRKINIGNTERIHDGDDSRY